MPQLTLPHTPLKPGDRVAVALSGGADSVALLLLLHAGNQQLKRPLGLGLSAIHVHHGLRGEEADGDQEFCQQLCDRLGIRLQTKAVDTGLSAKTNRETLEEAARNLRYAAFRDSILSGQARYVLTAHTLEDQAETVLAKLIRGAWLEGISGIAPMLAISSTEAHAPAGWIMRPLLQIRRDALRDYLRERNQDWREDSSNQDHAFTRNRLRHGVLPVLRQENPSIDTALANLAELAREEEARWPAELTRVLPQILLPGKPVRGGGRSNSTAPGERSFALELDRLRALEPALRRRVLRAAASQLGCRLSFDETARLLTLAGVNPSPFPDPTAPVKPGASLALSNGLLAERSLRELRLSRSVPQG